LFFPFAATTAPEKTGVALEGCLYAKNSQQKTARVMGHPDRFSFLLLFLIFLCFTP
jgi:hypothetical protein